MRMKSGLQEKGESVKIRKEFFGIKHHVSTRYVPSFSRSLRQCGKIKAMAGGLVKELSLLYEKAKAQLRACVENPFHIIKNIFKHRKVRYRGLSHERRTARCGARDFGTGDVGLRRLRAAALNAPCLLFNLTLPPFRLKNQVSSMGTSNARQLSNRPSVISDRATINLPNDMAKKPVKKAVKFKAMVDTVAVEVVHCVAKNSGKPAGQVDVNDTVWGNGVQNIGGLETCLNSNLSLDPEFSGDITKNELVSEVIKAARRRQRNHHVKALSVVMHAKAASSDAVTVVVIGCVAKNAGKSPEDVDMTKTVGQNGVQNVHALETCINSHLDLDPEFNSDITLDELVSSVISAARLRQKKS